MTASSRLGFRQLVGAGFEPATSLVMRVILRVVRKLNRGPNFPTSLWPHHSP